jgi:hypothetical protein
MKLLPSEIRPISPTGALDEECTVPHRDRAKAHEVSLSGAGRTPEKKRGRLPPPPKDNPERRRQAGARERRVYSLALNSTWILRGSLTDAVYGTPTDADRVLSEVT